MELRELLTQALRPPRRAAVLGIGSVLRSDDAAGMRFIELLGEYVRREDVLLLAGSTAPENFTGVIKKFAPDTLFLVDAAHMDCQPGEVGVLPAEAITGMSCSTHMLPLPVMIRYLEHEIGCPVVFLGIQPKEIGPGLGMCGEVEEGVRGLARLFREALDQSESRDAGGGI